MRDLRQDYMSVGWYRTAPFDSFINAETLASHFDYQKEKRNSVLMVHDPYHVRHGALPVRAFRMSDKFIEFYSTSNFSHHHWTQAGMQPSEMFEEVPIRINNSQLIQAYLVEMREAQPLDAEFQRLLADDHAPVAKSLGLLSDAIEEFARDQTAFLQHIRNVSKQQAQQGAHLAKRRAENVQREMNGEPPIVEDTSKNPLFKPIPPPSRNDRALLSQQMSLFCDSLGASASGALPKLVASAARAADADDIEGESKD